MWHMTDAGPNHGTVRVGVVQMDARSTSADANLALAERHLAHLAAQGARLVVLPELFNTGYDLEADLSGWTQPELKRHVETMVGWARRWKLVIATATLNRSDDGELLDCATVIDGQGVRAAASKQHLWGREKEAFARRDEPGIVVPTPYGSVGVAICYEAGFPETVRDLALRGADIIAIPAAFGRERLHAWDLLTRSRALENGCFVAAAGLTGRNASGAEFAGHSRVVDPTGAILADLGTRPGSTTAVLSLDAVGSARAAIPYLADFARGSSARRDSEDEGESIWQTLT